MDRYRSCSRPALTCRKVCSAFALLVLAMAGWPAVGHGDGVEVVATYQGMLSLPNQADDADGNPVKITGLSGIAWLGDDRYVAVMDNSRHVLLFRLSLTRTGKPSGFESLRIVTLSQQHDYEDVVPCPGPVVRSLRREHRPGGGEGGVQGEPCVLLCEEDTPAVRAFSLADGGMIGTVPLPENLLKRRPNRGLESLAIEPDGRSLWTANEEALVDDGPPAAVGRGTVVRLTRLPLVDEQRPMPFERLRSRREAPPPAAFQVAYGVDAPHDFVRVFDGQPLSGVAALVALGQGRLLVLERSGGPGLPPFANRLYLVDTKNAVDASAVERDLSERTQAIVEKRLLWSDSLGINLEGMCLGPMLADGKRALVAIADNGGVGTPNQLVALSLVTPAPAAKPGALGAVAAVVVIAWVVGRLTSP